MERSRIFDRELGLLWEKRFGQIIVPYSFSAQETTPTGMDCMMWAPNKEPIHIQIRHKNPYEWIRPEIGKCYGYERHRLDKDMKIAERGNVVLYVIHDYTRHGRASDVNEIEDWVAQHIKYLASNIDLERMGYTWLGDYIEKQRMLICYWHIDKFESLEELLEKLLVDLCQLPLKLEA